MRARKRTLWTMAAMLTACGSSNTSGSNDGSTSTMTVAAGDAGTGVGDGADDAAAVDGPSAESGVGAPIRGDRYCEILLAGPGEAGVHVDVYSTFGLNDCPEAAWSAEDPAAVASAAGVTKALLNGPRYWTLDRFVVASLIDPTPRSLGGIEMRHAGSIDVSLAAAMSLGTAAYTQHTIERNTTVQFDAGARVYELIDPAGKIYDMQSYSVQKVMQTEADLQTLGARLTLPTGWSYRTRVLDTALQITAVGGLATVIQDDFDDTYQQSQL